jgi:hypothetical protein
VAELEARIEAERRTHAKLMETFDQLGQQKARAQQLASQAALVQAQGRADQRTAETLWELQNLHRAVNERDADNLATERRGFAVAAAAVARGIE